MNNFIDFNGSTFVISGAGSGIGKAVAVRCSEFGASLLLLDKDESGLRITEQLCVGGNTLAVAIDLTEYESIEKAISSAMETVGGFSGLCHCAGIEYTLPIKSMTARHYENLFAVNAIAGFELARVMSKKKYLADTGASFVFLASIMGVVGRPGLTGYSASKGAIISAVRSMALELASKNIRVNAISPGTVMTDMIRNMLENLELEQRDKRLGDFPLGIGQPEDVANLVAFLLSNRSRWITGTNIILDGGYTAR